jgi:hypothetical protein
MCFFRFGGGGGGCGARINAFLIFKEFRIIFFYWRVKLSLFFIPGKELSIGRKRFFHYYWSAGTFAGLCSTSRAN